MELKERTARSDQICGFFRPEEGGTRGATKSALPETFRFFCPPGEQLGKVSVSE